MRKIFLVAASISTLHAVPEVKQSRLPIQSAAYAPYFVGPTIVVPDNTCLFLQMNQDSNVSDALVVLKDTDARGVSFPKGSIVFQSGDGVVIIKANADPVYVVEGKSDILDADRVKDIQEVAGYIEPMRKKFDAAMQPLVPAPAPAPGK